MKICPLCHKRSIYIFSQPIDYWACYNCHRVFVKGEDGTITMLDIHVEYNPSYSSFLNKLFKTFKV